MNRSQLAATAGLSYVSMCRLLNCKALSQGVASARLLDGNPSTIYSTESYIEHVKALLPFLRLPFHKLTDSAGWIVIVRYLSCKVFFLRSLSWSDCLQWRDWIDLYKANGWLPDTKSWSVMTLAMQEGATYDCANQISIFDKSLKFGPDYFLQNQQ